MPLPIFGKSSKNPADVVRSLKEALLILETKNTNTTGEAPGTFWPRFLKSKNKLSPIKELDP